ncbi:MAG: RNA methyltransferase [Polyangiaceae bacterium]|nr:RNA methyltransferase [Polyangiaceae bacterium]MCE7890401.1 RNA methyltransferase [Sorangiineae bacterium PRO1]MCL4751446.1 RNA methyltransferase [Myxococcales bacterium]
MKFFVTAPMGVERALSDELSELDVGRVRGVVGGVELSGRWEDAYRVCLESRIALRVLFPLADAPCRSERDLYDAAREIAWEKHLTPDTTLAVSAVGTAPGLDNTMFLAMRTKDAVADRLRALVGARPSVDRRDPDVSIFVRLARGRVTIALDLVGESLHRRGYREPGSTAPLKETLAAALLRMSGWDRRRPLVDPMCGSGTLPIEADLWARGVAPGLSRARFGFERWASFDPSLEKRLGVLKARARARVKDSGPRVSGFDRDPDAVALARRNAKRASAHVELARAELGSLRSTSPPGLVIVNPPYGERLAAGRSLYAELGEVLGRLGPGHRVAVLLGPDTPFRTPPGAERHRLKNGDLSCVLAVWDVR